MAQDVVSTAAPIELQTVQIYMPGGWCSPSSFSRVVRAIDTTNGQLSVDSIVRVEGEDKPLTGIHQTSQWSTNSVHGNGTQATLQLPSNLPREYHTPSLDMSVPRAKVQSLIDPSPVFTLSWEQNWTRAVLDLERAAVGDVGARFAIVVESVNSRTIRNQRHWRNLQKLKQFA